MHVGFIGLGHMGRPIVETLLRLGRTVTVHNRSQAVVDAMVAKGARRASSPAEVARAADVICTCLLTPEQDREVYLGAEGIAAGGRAGQTCIDFATVEPETSRQLGAALAKLRIDFLDIPVSGGEKKALAGTLALMAGGSPEAFERVRPLLDDIGEKIFYLGPIGSGTTAKVCNQIITGVTHVLVSEVMVLGTKAGLDPRTLYEVIRASSGRSVILDRAIANFTLPGKFDPEYTVIGMIKDMECGERTAKAFGVRQLLLQIAQQCYIEATGLGFGAEDISAVIKPMEAIAGIEVRDAPVA